MDFFGLDNWFARLPDDALICTPNQRLVRFYQLEYQAYHQSRGRMVFPALKCVSLELWQSELWSQACLLAPECAALGQPISALHKRAVWQDILGEDETLWAAGKLLDTALDADKLLAGWGIDPVSIANVSEEFALFSQWREDYQLRLNDYQRQLKDRQKQPSTPEVEHKYSGVIDVQTANNALLKAIENGLLNAQLPKIVIFSGFDHCPKPLQRLTTALQLAGVTSQHHQVLAIEHSCAKHAVFSTPKAELFAAAHWAKQHSECGNTVAVVVPDLGQKLAQVERVFQQVFEPQAILPGHSFDTRCYNISAGQPLVQCSLIAGAMRLLAWQGNSLPIAELTALVCSPMIGQWADSQARARLLAELGAAFCSVSLTQLKAAAAQANQSARDIKVAGVAKDIPSSETIPTNKATGPLDRFYGVLESVHRQLSQRNKPSQALPSVWQQEFVEQLAAWGWPGSRSLTSIEYQQIEHWQAALAEFSLLDDCLGEVDRKRAISLLTQILKRPFHIQTPPAKVQILGVLEAAGQLFDGLWWIGVDSHSWPEPLKPNPLLPGALQGEHTMPRSNARAELAYARALTLRLCRSAPQVIVSNAAFDGDEPLSPSPLIEALQTIAIEEVSVLHEWQQNATSPVQAISDHQAPALSVPANLSGGVGVIKRQAACPFQAFAIHRLGAVNSDRMTEGLDNRDRGNLMHAVLEKIWERLGSQQTLEQTDAVSLLTLVNEAVGYAMARFDKGRILGARLLQLESQRLQNRILEWLDQERKREPFTVSSQEKVLPLELAGLRLNLRMDRVDCLADGKTLAVIDYKTGLARINSWQSPRLDEPQIPLYTTALPAVGAAVFAQVSTHEMKFIGLTERPELFSQITDIKTSKAWPESFSALLAQWRTELDATAQAFVAGDARVAPKSAASCQRCELQSLCRIGEHISGLPIGDDVLPDRIEDRL